jgi:methylphosphotriester-DNA--protein-cysteine methyltransferase
MTPKLYARIARFTKAYRLREAMPDRSWTGIAYEAGYFDQRHLWRQCWETARMSRDFSILSGKSI